MTHLDTVGVHPVTLPKDTGTVDPNNYHSTLVLEEEVSFAGFYLPTCLYSVPGPAGHIVHPIFYIYDSPHS